VAVFDVPKTKPIPGIDGIQVSGWGEEYPLIEQSSLPVPLVEELTAKFGRNPRPKELFDPTLKHEIRARDTLLANIERKLKAIEFLQGRTIGIYSLRSLRKRIRWGITSIITMTTTTGGTMRSGLRCWGRRYRVPTWSWMRP